MISLTTNVYRLAVACLACSLSGCSNGPVESPDGYSLEAPVKLPLKEALSEISGICFPGTNTNFMYAIEDERGKIYTVDIKTGKSTAHPFGKKDDYEDLACYQQYLYVMNSKGTIHLLSMPSGDTSEFVIKKSFEKVVPPAEYEGMCVANDSLYVLCKEGSLVDARQNLGIYTFKISETGDLIPGTIIQPAIDITKAENEKKKQKVLPSAIAKNPVNKQWYILSGVNKLLMVFNEQFVLVNSYRLAANMFGQPEGLAFNEQGDMFISNEENTSQANILLFKYQQK